MRTTVTRIVVIASCLTIVLQAISLWQHTGRASVTRYYDPQRAALERGNAALDALLDGPGNAPVSLADAVPNTFALGLFPSGFDRHFLSVTTLFVPALVGIAAAAACPIAERPKAAAGKV